MSTGGVASPAFAQLGAYTSEGLTRLSLTGDGANPEEIDASLVSDNLLATFGERPQLGRVSGGVAAAEIALALVVLVGAGLLRRSMTQLLNTSPGFEPTHLLSFHVALPTDRAPDQRRVNAFFDQLLQKLSAIPGASGAATVQRGGRAARTPRSRCARSDG
jgi:hypothetical protein